MQGRLGYFLDDDAANQLSTAAILVELVKPVILFNGQGRDALANFRYVKNR